MRVLVLGATGKTGSLVVERALAKGHEVTVLVRDAKEFSQPKIRAVQGDATKREDVFEAMEGCEAAIDTIGGSTPYKDTTLERTAAHNLIEALQAQGARRLIVVSMMGLGTSREQAPFWYEHLLMPTFLRGSTRDKEAMENEVNTSGLDFVITRPAILKDGPEAGTLRVLEGEVKGHETTRADLANFLVDQLESNDHLGQAVTIVNS